MVCVLIEVFLTVHLSVRLSVGLSVFSPVFVYLSVSPSAGIYESKYGPPYCSVKGLGIDDFKGSLTANICEIIATVLSFADHDHEAFLQSNCDRRI